MGWDDAPGFLLHPHKGEISLPLPTKQGSEGCAFVACGELTAPPGERSDQFLVCAGSDGLTSKSTVFFPRYIPIAVHIAAAT